MAYRFLIFISALTLIYTVNAQNSTVKSRLFYGFGYAANYGTTGAYTFQNSDYDPSSYYDYYVEFFEDRVGYASYLDLYASVRYNLIEFSDEASVSASVSPTIDLTNTYWTSSSNYSGTPVRTPILLSYNINAGATKTSWANTGFSIGLGANIIINGMNIDSQNKKDTFFGSNEHTLDEVPSSWILPALKVTFIRKRNPNHTWEYGFQFSRGSKSSLIDNFGDTFKSRPFDTQFHAGVSF
jgi:hypothetical protein